ncbi:two-component sensor histidine kinase [Ochrobactrum sp. POC9]|uniref:sensor histidine kinase n=1 Tax=unclassified Ochrobactrum TaxID=239106 RepID=UPI000D708968|nr:sensor histidine kinase KdpD [Ochrobactrum sp. POC9]MCH4542485.1 sensor histidine kinase KdpD [Ochrobactrum sp. A-1]PWU76368.1 two-component sensor histidine kinase [Ochrobactrum sp. POC9]
MTSDPLRFGENRPSPDALLEQAERETRGRLKIFLGAAPGVGKTYEMLMSGRARKADEIDVVIGVVETHGRAETQALTEGLEIVPRAQVSYRGHQLDEMDIDAVLARRPQLVLVDELAHTNASGSRHPKRYQDVEEILAHGIDVYTTLNIQHVESLNDVVAQITRIRVRETVPDSIIDRADDIELIDLTPNDLIKRLNEGKIYLPKTAKRAIRNYFSPGNLTALRELALRRTAQRVDEQLVSHMRAHAIEGPWAAGDRILVAIDERPRSVSLVRYARRLADRLRAPWAAIHIETARSAGLTEEAKDRLATALRLAEQLGGETIIIPGQSVAEDIVRYASAHNFTQIVAGKSIKSRWREMIDGSIARELVRLSGAIDIHITAGVEHEYGGTSRKVGTARQKATLDIRPYLIGIAMTGVALIAGLLLDQFLDVRSIALVFVVGVLGVAVTLGLWPALFSSVLSAFAYNFFFLSPLYTLSVADPESVVALIFFLFVSFIASNLASRVQRQAAAARQRARMTEDLYLFSKKLAGTGSLDDVLWATAFQIASMLRVRVVILLPEGNTIAVRGGYPPDDTLDDADIAAAHWTWEHDLPAGRGANTLPGAKRLYLPLKTARTSVGVIGLDNDRMGPILTPEQQRLLEALADQAAIAIERVQLVGDVERAKLAAEADKLRSALLTSISHDLKTPLAAILGAATTLRDYSSSLPDADRSDLIATVVDQSERLNRFIANLLDMTRIEAGAMKPNLSFHYIGDLIGAALNRAAKILAHHQVNISVPADLPMVQLDAVLFEQVLFNLFDNAAKYAPENTPVTIKAHAGPSRMTLEISDWGPGIPPNDLERVFDTFYRVRKGDHVQAGTGLGLSIARGFIEAMGGSIRASNRHEGAGAIFTITLPVPADEIDRSS